MNSFFVASSTTNNKDPVNLKGILCNSNVIFVIPILQSGHGGWTVYYSSTIMTYYDYIVEFLNIIMFLEL